MKTPLIRGGNMKTPLINCAFCEKKANPRIEVFDNLNTFHQSYLATDHKTVLYKYACPNGHETYIREEL